MKKLKLILISRKEGSFQDLENALAETEMFNISRMHTPAQVFAEIEQAGVDVVIADEQVQGTSGMIFARELVRRNPFINCALVSSLYPGEFHEATEGLGVFMQLPVRPGPKEAVEICAHLEKIQAVVSR